MFSEAQHYKFPKYMCSSMYTKDADTFYFQIHYMSYNTQHTLHYRCCFLKSSIIRSTSTSCRRISCCICRSCFLRICSARIWILWGASVNSVESGPGGPPTRHPSGISVNCTPPPRLNVDPLQQPTPSLMLHRKAPRAPSQPRQHMLLDYFNFIFKFPDAI